LSEFRVWNRTRNPDEIRKTFDRTIEGSASTAGLIFRAAGAGPWGKAAAGAKIVKTSDFPPLLTPDEAAQLDAKFAKYRTLAEKPGDVVRGQAMSAVCTACHPSERRGQPRTDLSGAGAMGDSAPQYHLPMPRWSTAIDLPRRVKTAIVDALSSEDNDGRGPPARRGRSPHPSSQIRAAKYLRRSLMRKDS
jgi:hypothetical protein